MSQYHKIQSVFKRDKNNNYKTFLYGQYSIPEFEILKDIVWEGTEKFDGMNMRAEYTYGTLKEIYGKTEKAKIPNDLRSRMLTIFTNETAQELDMPQECVTFFGEGIGAGIQKGGYYSDNKDFVLFDVNVNGVWLSRKSVKDIAIKLGCESSNVVFTGNLHEAIETVRHGNLRANWNNEWYDMEGLVLRPHVELRTNRGDRIITKIKRRDFQYE